MSRAGPAARECSGAGIPLGFDTCELSLHFRLKYQLAFVVKMTKPSCSPCALTAMLHIVLTKSVYFSMAVHLPLVTLITSSIPAV